ncbi:insulinase family protein [Litoribacillus peritrichatus]|uniref:Protease 3 n=1 Tax=Litoribacillus peritrichatus TaxID=718191 RepID=A0ABP7MYH5_9GAMM
MNSKFSLISIGILAIMAVAYFSLKNSQFDPNIVVTPDTDNKTYQYLELSNKLRVLLISDPEADKASAALDVHVGSLRDPEGREGLAHFLEHMLFLGTEDFPEAGEYQQFITKHGGSHNAFTASEHTNYFFEIDKDHLAPALDRFSAFFKTPLFTEQYVDREKNAVHSEYQAKLKDDVRRNYEVIRSVFNPQHPASHFSVGALETLSDRPESTIQEDLRAFYDKYYSANLMTLVVSGKEDTETLKKWVEEKFSAIPNKTVKLDAIKVPLFTEGTLPAEVFINPIKNTRTLSLVFPIKPLAPYYREKPTQYISNLIGHEGEGSLLSTLKEQGLADGLSAGAGFNTLEYATFHISVKLTEKGLAQYNDVTQAVFSYINLLTAKGPDQNIYDEQSKLNNIAFRFQEQRSASQTTSHLAGNLQKYLPREVIRGPYLMARYDAKIIEEYLAYLTPSNVLITVAAQDLPTNQTTKWYQTPYSLQQISDETLAAWKSAPLLEGLSLPEENKFVPEHLSLLEMPSDATDKPTQLIDDEGFELWHRTNTEFQSPKADIYINIRSPKANNSPIAGVEGNLFAKLVNDSLNEYSYPAYLAGLDYTFYRNSRGVTIKVSGYSEKLETLLNTVLDAVFNAPLEQKRFDIYKEEMVRAYRNEAKDKPYSLAYKSLMSVLMSSTWSLPDRLNAAEQVTLPDLVSYRQELLKEIEVVMLTHGNLTKDTAKTLASNVKDSLFKSSTPTVVPANKVAQLSKGEVAGLDLETKHNDSVLLTYYQGKEISDLERAYAGLLSQVVSTPFYNQIRTEKQRGYIVFATPIPLARVPGFTLITQSHVVSPKTLANDYQSFLLEFRDTLSNMSAEDFAQHKAGLISKLNEKPQRLSQLSDLYWQQLDQQQTDFNTRERLVKAIGAITQPELVSFYDRFFFGDESRELVIQYQGQSIESEEPELLKVNNPIKDVNQFKLNRPTF